MFGEFVKGLLFYCSNSNVFPFVVPHMWPNNLVDSILFPYYVDLLASFFEGFCSLYGCFENINLRFDVLFVAIS
jgi:hypothetical protein